MIDDPEFLEAVETTPGAKLTGEGISLDVVRYQKPEQFGEESVRTGVFYLPEAKSPYQRHYTTGKGGYGGGIRTEGRTTYRQPVIVRAASGGKGPELAYDAIKGKGSYQQMRNTVFDKILNRFYNKPTEKDIADVLKQYGGNPLLAWSILQNSTKGNTLAYAIQEHIVASAVRNAGYDAVISYSKIKGQWRLSEVFDVRATYYPEDEKWEEDYADYYREHTASPRIAHRPVSRTKRKDTSIAITGMRS